jgi:thymidylate synthase ThyX
MTFSDLERKILEVYVTSATDPIYAIKSEIPPEMFGAFGSYFSRNPKDFRTHLLAALKGQIQEDSPDQDLTFLTWLTDGSLKTPSQAIIKGLEKSQEFFRTWYGKFGHKSIANMVWIPMVATNVSQLFAKELAYDQLAFFIEQSTRFVEFDTKNIVKDPDIMSSRYSDLYLTTLEHLATAYHSLLQLATDYYKEIYPYESWLLLQDENTRTKPEKFKQRKYEREIKGKALDIARFLLPQAIQTNLAFIIDARSLESKIAAWKGHPLSEIRNIAYLLEKHGGQIVPSLLKYTEENPYYSEKLQDYNQDLPSYSPIPFKKGVTIISYDPDALNKTVASLITAHNKGGSFRQSYQKASQMSFEEKINLLRRITQNRSPYDEFVELGQAFDITKIVFELRTDIGALRDWRRHQKWDRNEAQYTLKNGIHRPYLISLIGKRASLIFDRAIEIAYEAEKRIAQDFPYQAQYVVPMAAMHSLTFSGGLDQLQYMLYLRSTPQGNFSYREDAFNIAEAVTRVHPWLLGYKSYPNNKDFFQVYRDAPLKSILRLQTQKTKFHE